MSAYYNQRKDMICIRELYSDTCEIDNEANIFFTNLRLFLKSLTTDTELEAKFIKYMCEHKLIFPNQFLHTTLSVNDIIINDVVNLGFEKDVANKLVTELANIANQSIVPKKFIDSDPRTNGTISKQKTSSIEQSNKAIV